MFRLNFSIRGGIRITLCDVNIEEEIKDALMTTGVFYLKNHGVSRELIRDLEIEAKKFYRIGEKNNCGIVPMTLAVKNDPCDNKVSKKNYSILTNSRTIFP